MTLLLIPGLLLAGLLGALATFPWQTRRLGEDWLWIALTPVPALSSYIWGWVFVVEPGVMPPPPQWHEDILLLFLAISVALLVIVPMRAKQARPFAVSISVMMLGVTLFAGLLSAMRVSGVWM